MVCTSSHMEPEGSSSLEECADTRPPLEPQATKVDSNDLKEVPEASSAPDDPLRPLDFEQRHDVEEGDAPSGEKDGREKGIRTESCNMGLVSNRDEEEEEEGGEGEILEPVLPSSAIRPFYRPRSRSSSSKLAPPYNHYMGNGHCKQGDINERTPLASDVEPPPRAKEGSEEYEWRAPDGGWGWMVLLGTVVVNTLIPGLVKSFGVLFVEFINVFHATPSSVAWIPAITFALYNLLGPVASLLSTRISCRFATIVGGISATLGLALSYFATSIEFLYFSYGVLGGIGAGMSYTPGILIVGQYFEKRRGFANGICASGSALGSIILPPFLNYLLMAYGCRGAILIMCALIMNVCVGAALYQPIEWHLKKVPVKPDDSVTVTESTKDSTLHDDLETRSWRNNNSFGSVAECLSPQSKRLHLRRPVSNPRFQQLVGGISEVEERLVDSPKREDVVTPAPASHGVTFTIGSGPSPSVASYTTSTTGLAMGSTSGLGSLGLHRSPSVVSTVSSASFAYLSTIYHGNTTAAYQLNQIAGRRDSLSESRSVLAAMTTSQGSIARYAPDRPKRSGGGGGVAQPPKKNVDQPKVSAWKLLFDVSLLKNTVFLLITYTVVASGIGYTNLLIVIPAFADGLGLAKTQYALLLSIIAGADLVGRIGGAWLSDLASFPCKYLYMAGFIVSGLALMFMPQNTSFEGLAACCAVFGLASGIYIGLMAVLLINHLGADNLASSFGLSLAINGVVMMGGPPIIGAIRERIGNYEPVIFMLGVIILSGGLIMILEPFATQHEKRKLVAGEANTAEIAV